MKTPILMLLGMAAAAPAIAQEGGFYATGGYTVLSSEIEDFESVNLGAIGGRAGWMVTPNFGGEVEGMVGIVDEEFDEFGAIEATAGLNYAVGAFARAQVGITNSILIYGRSGVVMAEIEAEASGFGASASESDSESGVGVGGGIEYGFLPHLSLYVDYTRYEFDESQIDGVSFGGKFRF
ncbi:MAG: porin family protein [Hyphomonadaceae bacterium]|nr:porin family protein [Hyphomonadaceae bacterium]